MSKITTEELLKSANTVRGLAMDGVQAANSGHPGMPMGMADVATVLFLKHLNHCPSDPEWCNRDRFILSGGHGSMLIYSMLHLSGYDLPLSELKDFRQLGSKTPGHPEFGETPGVETTTGPLGQGCANAVGMALSESMLAARFNTETAAPIDHFTYVFCGDGDLMEGISHEAFSLAGHLKLRKLVLFYDDNRITIEGSTDLAESDDVKKRFQSYNWNVIETDAHDFEKIDRAIRKAKRSKDKPTIVICTSHIGKGSPNKVDTSSVHGEPLGAEEIILTKRNIGLPEDEHFHVPEDVKALYEARHRSLKRKANRWKKDFKQYCIDNPEKADLWKIHTEDIIPEDIESYLPEFEAGTAMATRASGGKVMQGLAKALPQLIGGSADLAPSTKTLLTEAASIAADSFAGRNLHFGIREHAMCSMLNGMSVHGGWRLFGSTFFVFSDYCRPAIRLAALMGQPVIYVFTHDSFYVGEDGPTHQPIEHIAALRCIPNVTVIRPADPTESGAAWIAALRNKKGPSCLLLTRQNLKVIDRNVYPKASELEKGAYTLCQSAEGTPELILIATGSEVQLALDAAESLASETNVRVVSMPSVELFENQSAQYREEILPAACSKRVVIEAGSSFGWHKYSGPEGKIVSKDDFGQSGPAAELAEKFGFTVENVIAAAKEVIG